MCRSKATNARSSATAPATRPRVTGDVQPHSCPPSVAAKSSDTRPTVRMPAPTRSSRCRRRSTRSWRNRPIRKAAATPTGAFTKKTQRQPIVVVMMLPMAGPTTAEAPQTPEKRPWILARCSLSKTSPRIVNEIGWTAPAPRPWIARKRISCVIEPAKPHSIEPPTKRASPVMKMGLRPYMSASRAYSGTVTVEASRYAEKTQPYSERPPRLPMMVGMAVETTVPSSAATARAAMIPAAMTNCSGVIPIRRATAW